MEQFRTKLHRKSQQLTTTSPTYCRYIYIIMYIYILRLYIHVCTELWAWTCTPCRHWNYHYIQSNHAWRAKGVKIWDHVWQHHWIKRGMKTKHWPRQPKAFLISSWFRFINWLQPHSTTSTTPFSAASLAVIEQRPTWQYQWAMCPLQSSLLLPPTSWFKTPSFPEDPSHILGRNTPKTIERVVPVSGVFGDMKKTFVEHCWTSLSSPKTESITWNLRDKSSANFPLPSEPLCFGLPSGTVPPPQSLSVFISWGNVELHSHEFRHPKNLTEALQKMPRKCQSWLQTHRQVVPGDPRSEGTEDTEGSLHSKGSAGYSDTQVQSESLRKSVGQIPGNPAEQWQWYYRNESLLKAVHWSKTFFFFWLRLRDTLFFWGPGRLAPQSKPVACSSTGWLH